MAPTVNRVELKATLESRSPIAGDNGKSPTGTLLLAAALNALAQAIAIVDASGTIVAVNDAWRAFAGENGMRWSHYGVGYNYLADLEKADQESDGNLAQMVFGIRRVLEGSTDSHHVEYACESPSGCYFLLQVTSFYHAGARHVLLSRENITFRKLNEDKLRAAKEAAEAACREEEIRHQSAEHRRRIAQAVADTLALASSGRPVEDAFRGMVEHARDAFASQAAAIYSAEERWDRPRLVAACGALRTTTRKSKSPIAPTILARAISDRYGVGISDVESDMGLPEAGTHAATSRPGYRALLVTPIHRKERLYGYLALFYAEPRDLSGEDTELAHLFGQQVTLALDNAELRSHAEKVAIENERNRLARDLHDAVTQTLFSASVVAEALPRVWERDPAEGMRALDELRLWIRGALAELRTLLMELRPAALIDKPLPDLMRQLSEAAATRLRLPAICEISAQSEPPTEVKLALYRIAQEALNNMAKHSSASHVAVRYLALPQRVELAIVDNGRGFDLDRQSPGQMGISIMRERAQHIGANLTIQSAPGEGTEVRVEWRPRGRKNLHE